MAGEEKMVDAHEVTCFHHNRIGALEMLPLMMRQSRKSQS
jgi:hypothetical protein